MQLFRDRKAVLFGVAAATGAFLLPIVLLAQGDREPPKISGISIVGVTATSAVVTWSTDEDADSLVNFGLTKSYGIARDPLPDKKQHRVTLVELEPSTVYHLRVVSADPYGNQALSGDYILATKSEKPDQELEDLPQEERINVERAIDAVEELRTEEGLRAVSSAVQDRAREVLGAPEIIGNPRRIEDIGADYVVIAWGTNQKANSIVRYAREIDYRPNSSDPYTTEAGDRDVYVRDHKVRVTGLIPGTTYHFSVESETELGQSVTSNDDSFTTKAVLPSISGFRIVKVEENSATLSWRTNVPAAGTVEYTDTRTKQTRTAGSAVFASSQTVKISDLKLGTRYQVVVKAENALGEKIASNPLFFTTTRDTAAPLISKVSNESTLYPQAEAKVQTIVSWGTDEASFCQFFYREGLAPNIEPRGLGEEKEPRTNHVQVVTEFLPSTVYQFWVECKDHAGNKTKSENFVLFTPNKEKSIIDIILENFEGAFGWVKNIGK